MRDSFGGVFMIRLMLVFLFIYVSFTAVSLNYAKAFRIKNKVIDLIEQEEILDLNAYFAQGDGAGTSKIDKILNDANYNKECNNGNGIISDVGEPSAYCYRGIIIEESGKNVKGNIVIYNVYTYADWNLGTLNLILALSGQNKNSRGNVNGTWEISGEARVKDRLTSNK